MGAGGGPTAELWSSLGRPCVLDEGAQMAAIEEFYVSSGFACCRGMWDVVLGGARLGGSARSFHTAD